MEKLDDISDTQNSKQKKYKIRFYFKFSVNRIFLFVI